MICRTRKILTIGILFLGVFFTIVPVSAQLKVGDTAPAFKLHNVNTKKFVTLSDFIDKKIVIVHFWKSK